jgi:mycothiol system anti-sigma-R factor
MSQGCGHAVDHLYEYLDGEMRWTRRVRISWHLKRCPECVGAYDFEARLKSKIRGCPCEEPSQELYERIRASIREEAARDDP